MLPEFIDNRNIKVAKLSVLSTNPPPGYSSYSFMLEAESTSGSYSGRKDKSMRNPNDLIGYRTHGRQACSAVSQPTVPARTTWSV
jgi:hypothetical protein